MRIFRSGLFRLFALLAGITALAQATGAETLSFAKAIELALKSGGNTAAAAAQQARARANYSAARRAYAPTLILGSGAAFTYGFPLSIEGSAPSIFNVNAQSFLFNAAQREFIRAAKSEWDATISATADRKDLVVLETALTYIQLARLSATLPALREQEAGTLHLEEVIKARVAAGIEGELENTRARLNTARTRARQAEAAGTVDVLRLRLSQLTGVPSDSLEVSAESIPPFPEISQQQNLSKKAIETSWAVKIADQTAAARHARARGEHKALYPALDLVGQYGLFSKFNNFEQFFKKFQRNNATVGVALRFPIFNYGQKSQAAAADAEALKARSDAEAVKQQVSSETLRLQRAVGQMVAAREVAKLEHELALADVQSVEGRIQAGQASIRDRELARMQEHERYAALVNAGYEVDKAQLELMRATGELENWARSQP